MEDGDVRRAGKDDLGRDATSVRRVVYLYALFRDHFERYGQRQTVLGRMRLQRGDPQSRIHSRQFRLRLSL